MKRMISGIKPTGALTLGNWLGAIKEFVKYQDTNDLYVFVADLHALTTAKNPNDLNQNIIDLIAIYLAAGLDPAKCTIFLQSAVPAHNQLEWVLTCNTDLPDLLKMPQYKNYCEKHSNKATPTGMLMYPSLMAADILLYDADVVPCGTDQVSHIFLTKTIAERFNKHYGNVFKLPEAVTPEIGAKIMSLSDPTKKMSKSESNYGTIYLLDDIEVSKKKIMRALTDSENKVYYNPETKPGISNLMTIYSILAGISFEEIETKYKDITNYGVFKKDLCVLLENELVPLQQKVNDIKKNTILLKSLLVNGAEKANRIAGQKIKEVYNTIGLIIC